MPKLTQLGSSFAIAALLLMAGHLAGHGSHAWDEAFAAQPQTQQELKTVIQLLQAVDSAYASGNGAEAQAKYNDAKSSWKNVMAAVSKKEADEIQLLFDTLGEQLSKNAPSADVRSTISDILDELHEND